MRSVRATIRGRSRAWALAVLLALLVVYDEIAPYLWHEGVWWDVVWIACVVMPATFALVLIALPYAKERWVPRAGIVCVLLAVVLTVTHVDVGANFARLAAATLLAWWFLSYFEELSWVVVVACIIPWVDAYSVWRGPTKTITTNHPHVFTVLSYAFPVPGRHAAANLGVPDLLFFALFLAAARLYGLRVVATWVCLVAGLGLTIAGTVWWDLSGLPALPAIAVGFLLPNIDLLWRKLRPVRPVSDGV
jgi:hypothetical protein